VRWHGGHTFHENKVTPRASWGHQQVSWQNEIIRVARWVKKLPNAAGDVRGMRHAREAVARRLCRLAKVAVPDEVAVIGVDNEELACKLAIPPLSSVIPDAFRVGYEGGGPAQLRVMNGMPAPEGLRYIPPLGVVTRQSTDVTAIADRASPVR